jgi:citrate lyase synthetase
MKHARLFTELMNREESLILLSIFYFKFPANKSLFKDLFNQ